MYGAEESSVGWWCLDGGAPWLRWRLARLWPCALRCKVLRDLYTKMMSRQAAFLPWGSLRSGRFLGGAWWWPLFSKLGHRWQPYSAHLLLQKAVGQLPLCSLELLLCFNCAKQRWINVHEEEFFAARAWSLWMKFELIQPIFIGHLVPSHSLRGL
jgi:hypothetical protein